MRIKSVFWLNLQLGRTNITRANFTCTNVKDSLSIKYQIFSITEVQEKYKKPTKSNVTNYYPVGEKTESSICLDLIVAA